ncbi:MAG: hypothetical protein KDA33_01670, partial [Phycisphaerales bacterium]|nr:hypothetical protein [Phycisphaerales bacterium]
MSTEQWRRIGELFEKALALTQAERADFLAACCQGDAVVRAELESLLAHARPEDSLFSNMPEHPSASEAD